MSAFERLWFDDEGVASRTSAEQCGCERDCSSFLQDFLCYDAETLRKFRSGGLINVDNEIRLLKSKHAAYLQNFLKDLPGGFISLEASRPWIVYWITHALYLLGHEPVTMYPRIIRTLSSMQNVTGGYGGGQGHLSQGAPNYAAVLTLCTIATEEAWSSIDRPAMYNYFCEMKQSCGGFSIHMDGEVDSRSTYTVLCVARLLNILTDELRAGAADYLLRCQTYEGGFGGEPGNEAHGGYNFCAIAALLILGDAQRCDLAALESWLLRRQSRLEGGFQGRTNKLVDSCYSFWQGAAVAIAQIAQAGGSDVTDLERYQEHLACFPTEATADDVDEVVGSSAEDHMKEASDHGGCLQFNQKALQRYVLHCAQSIELGGMRDKPGKSRDFYHTCYSLSGLSVSQRTITSEVKLSATPAPVDEDAAEMEADGVDVDTFAEAVDRRFDGLQVYGDIGNLLAPTSVVFNIGLPQLQRSLDYFSALPLPCDHGALLAAYRHARAVQP